ncbi:unnamed protein product [Cladocopium goreaui]|uniref:Ubiquitinyl hydrolase 1 n=1 Tax=Cladocopium goreaui TaxID=2562237 RepID=A0A9P1BL01_9DINO|nr:unnamed protein product [Cladocopium goreaui]
MAWSASDSALWPALRRKGRFEVVGFGTNLTPEVNGKPTGFLRGVLRWFGQYESDKKSLSRASPSVLTGDPSQQLATEDDVLFLKQLPTFNGDFPGSFAKHQPTFKHSVMDDWDPFADPADAPPAPARPAPVAVPVAVDAVPVEEATGDIPDLPSLAELEQQLQKAQLESCPELVQAAFAGDEAKVQELLKGGADPNTIWLREERLKGSDGCCQCAISWEEYTAPIAACMELKTEICELLLLHDQTDMNVVCCGLHEFGPYKHFTVLDMAKQVQSPLMEKLLARGAKPAAKCPTPPWPREPRGADDSDDALLAAAALPARPSANGAGPYAELLDAMQQNRCKSLELRQRLFKQMMLEWHPDKRPASERSLATAALGAADVELLLSYLTAPYLRIPLLLGFFTDRHRASALREPQLQVVLDAALFELAPSVVGGTSKATPLRPGQWQSPTDLLKSPPDTVPAADRRHLATAAGLLFNELMRSPQAVVHAVLCLLQVAIEKDVGRPESANDGLILYVIRLATRIESYLAFLVSHGRRGAYLERSGASYDAFVRSLAGPQDDALLMELQAAHREIRTQLQGDVLRMLKDWLRYTSKRPPGKFLAAACRIHAHVALIFKNVPELDTAAVSGFLSAQAFLNINHRLEDTSASSGEAGCLGVGEVELFDAFESRRSRITLWLREDAARASLVLRMVEQAVTNRGRASSEASAEEWAELRPGDFVPKKHLPSESWFSSQSGEAFHEWMLRTTQGGAAGRQVSINLGQYGTKRDGLELLPSWAVCSPDYLEAFGRSDVHCVEREVAAKRDWKDLVGHAGFSIQRWHPQEHEDPHAQVSGSVEAWALQLLQPVLSALPGLNDFELRMRCQVPPDANELWLTALRADGTKSRKELRVQRQPAVVEVYNILEHGRHFYRTMVFTSDTSWSFHVPSAGQRLLRNAGSFAWSVAAGDADAAVGSSASNHFSVLVLRNSQIHLPRRFLRGLLPDALLQRYRFWRCRGSNSAGKGGVGEIEGEEVIPSKDEATSLRIQLMRAAEGTTARVERRPVEEPNAAPEVLVNLRQGNGLTKILARLENLSHILVWAGLSLRVELPRLRLSFTAQKQRMAHWRLKQRPVKGAWLGAPQIPSPFPDFSLSSGAAGRALADAVGCGKPTAPGVCMGRDKWLGGELGEDGNVYGIPGSASRVLKIVPSTDEVELTGPEMLGKFKWLRGIVVDDYIYGVPTNCPQVLQISCCTGQVDLVGPVFKGDWKWHGGVFCPEDRCIYAIPCNAESVLKISCCQSGAEVSTIAAGSPALKGRCKWYGGLLGDDGCIYGIPNCAESVLKIDPRLQDVQTIGPKFGDGGQKWHGGVVGKDGCIYGIPSHADVVLKIEPHSGAVRTIGKSIESGKWRPNGKYKYGGGVVADDGTIYCFPSDADYVLKIQPETEEVVTIGPAFEGHNKYAIPCNAPGVLQIMCHSDEVKMIPIDMENPMLQDKWEGGVVANGVMYCMPQNAKRVLKIAPQ